MFSQFVCLFVFISVPGLQSPEEEIYSLYHDQIKVYTTQFTDGEWLHFFFFDELIVSFEGF